MITLKTELEVRERIRQIEHDYSHVLTGTLATIRENAPRALMQLDAESELRTLHWFLGETYTSKLKQRTR